MRLEKKNAGLLKCKALKLKKKLANSCCSSLSVENLEAKTFDQRGCLKGTDWGSVCLMIYLFMQWWRR